MAANTNCGAEVIACAVAAAFAGWLWFYCWHLWPWDEGDWYWWYIPSALTFTAVSLLVFGFLAELIEWAILSLAARQKDEK